MPPPRYGASANVRNRFSPTVKRYLSNATASLTKLMPASVSAVFFEEPRGKGYRGDQDLREAGVTDPLTIANVKETYAIKASSRLFFFNSLLAFFHLATAISIFSWSWYVDQSRITTLVVTSGLPYWTGSTLDVSLNVIGTYKIHILLLLIPLMSGILSVIRALSMRIDSCIKPRDDVISTARIQRTTYFKNIRRGIFGLQFLERLTSGTLLVWLVSSIVGITEVSLLVLTTVLTIALFVMVYFHDSFNYLVSKYHRAVLQPVQKPRKNILSKKSNVKRTKDSVTYIFRSYGAYISAFVINFWLWTIILVHYGFAGASNQGTWLTYRWLVVPLVGFFFMLEGFVIFVWTSNAEYEDDYIERHTTASSNNGPSSEQNKLTYIVDNWNNNLRFEVASLTISGLCIMTFVWTMWLGMLYS